MASVPIRLFWNSLKLLNSVDQHDAVPAVAGHDVAVAPVRAAEQVAARQDDVDAVAAVAHRAGSVGADVVGLDDVVVRGLEHQSVAAEVHDREPAQRARVAPHRSKKRPLASVPVAAPSSTTSGLPA